MDCRHYPIGVFDPELVGEDFFPIFNQDFEQTIAIALKHWSGLGAVFNHRDLIGTGTPGTDRDALGTRMSTED